MNDLQLEQFVYSMLRDSSNTMSTDMMLRYLKQDHGLNLTFERVRDMRIKVLHGQSCSRPAGLEEVKG